MPQQKYLIKKTGHLKLPPGVYPLSIQAKPGFYEDLAFGYIQLIWAEDDPPPPSEEGKQEEIKPEQPEESEPGVPEDTESIQPEENKQEESTDTITPSASVAVDPQEVRSRRGRRK
jgi:hypothetical protein